MKAMARLTAVLALAILILMAITAAARAGTLPADPERAALQDVLQCAGLLADPIAGGDEPAAFGNVRVSHLLSAGEPRLRVEYGATDALGRPTEATVTVERQVEGALEIRQADSRGRDHVVSKDLLETCARQVALRRIATGDDPTAMRWRIVSVSPFVGSTPSGTASLPLVDLNTHAVSGGFLSAMSDLGELSVYPQTCAVTPSGDSVQVYVAGLDADAAVCVFASGRLVAAVRDGSRARAMVRLDGAGLRQIGVTVYSGRTLSDAAAPADSRTWVLPILVGARPPRAQEWFSL